MERLAELNPFAVFTPEGLSAERVVEIFSTAMPGLDVISVDGHVFLFGTRGSGKSILLRYLEPDCQSIVQKRPVRDLAHFGMYVSFRETEAQISELARFNNMHGQIFFNEHLLVLAIGARIIARLLRNLPIPDGALNEPALRVYGELTDALGEPAGANDANDARAALAHLAAAIRKAYRTAIQYVKRHAFRSEILSYEGHLHGYDDFLLPLVALVREAMLLRPGTSVFLMLDDADSLTTTQMSVINSWIARRLSAECSIKVAAQVNAYRTMLTIGDRRIEAPHDYHEINLSDMGIRRGNELVYRQRIAAIVNQRLRAINVTTPADKYFREDHSQQIAIEKIGRRLRRSWNDGEGRGHRERDDVQRYARPDFIRSLGGARKSRNKYSYSGFEQLVYISSGVPRFFLEAAADMYDVAYTKKLSRYPHVTEIPANIQNDVIREHAQRQFILDIKALSRDAERLDGTPQRAVRLHNLINGLGASFEAALLDEVASERKQFAFAFSDVPDPDVEAVLDLGVRYGYFFRGVIGRKEGIGRTSLYLMSRRLAPLFNLDPTGVAAYKFMTSAAVMEMMDHPDRVRNRLRRSRGGAAAGAEQPTLDFDKGVVDD
ncbi:MAG: hypothetical protein K2W81_00375 [Sphingomonas sp.]|uniref:ORC-CDC6 family AAA ATPase n=1 Tax=Sphingomonas sp. TaxID=28214 RepID=UPI0025DB279A|nr:hypothetical protein [Sphingomonas sp.]MBY0282396.1 hypothetical protein [Sphingomonas sp.]